MNQFVSTKECIEATGLRLDEKTDSLEYSNKTCRIYSSKKLTLPDIKWFSSEHFQFLPKPLKDEWLAENKELGQTFSRFLSSTKISTQNAQIVFVPIEIEEQNQIKHIPNQILIGLVEFLSIFYNIPVKQADTLSIIRKYKKEFRQSYYGEQFNASKLISILKSYRKKDEFMIGVTMFDIACTDEKDNNFVFGLGDSEDKACICSLARYNPPFINESKLQDSWLLKGAFSLITHELGHVFGLEHCIYYRCLMNGANSLEEDEKIPLYLCPVCLNKLNVLFNFDIKERYGKLLDFFEKYNLDDEVKWHSQYLQSRT
jgi:archaemetzincin